MAAYQLEPSEQNMTSGVKTVQMQSQATNKLEAKWIRLCTP